MNMNFNNMNTNFNNINLINMNNHYFKTPLSFNDFEVIAQLGKGFFGSVYKVKYKLTGQIYAIKRYEKAKAKKEQELDYYREKAILYDLNKRGHPAIVKLYTDFEDSTTRNLVMECVEGITLKKKRGYIDAHVPQNEVINILIQLLRTLDFLHTKCHIIHRDIKPDNIMIQNNNQIKLLDFGISVYLENSDKKLVSNKSFKGELHYVPPEMIFYGFPPNYGYKMDIFSLGFTMYSFMNPTNNEDEVNLPKKTERNSGGITRKDLYINNTFYDPWLIKFVEILYDNNQNTRPTAAGALELLQKLQFNPNNYFNFKSNNRINQINNINNINVLFSRKDSSNVINNINNMNQFNSTFPNPLSTSAQQMNKYPNNNLTINNIPRINSLNNQNYNRMQPLFLNAEMGNENRVLSSMKSLLQVLYHLDGMSFIQAQIFSLFSNNQIDYTKYFIHSYYQMLNNIYPKDCNQIQINQIYYTQLINEFIRKVFINNNSGISGTRPIILFYMITSIITDEFFQYFNSYQNKILDKMIQDNYISLDDIIPMTSNQNIYESVSKNILDFKNNNKSPLVDNFYFFILSVSRCPNCDNLFGIRTKVIQFLQLEVKNIENKLSDLISDYFGPIPGTGNYFCKNCKLKGQKYNIFYCLNLPNYLVLEFEDKNSVNFNDEIVLPLFNGTMCSYQYVSSIYKFKDNNNVTDFVAVFKSQDKYFYYSDDKIEQCDKEKINMQCPSLAIYRKIS